MHRYAPVGDADRGERSDTNSPKPPTLACWVVMGMGVFCISASASARDVHCPPSLGAVEVDGNLLIAARCHLDGTRVRGNVRLFAGGALTAEGVHIEGNVEAERSDFVTLTESQVDGNLVLEELVGDRSSIELSEINGNVRARRNRSRVDIADNRIDGNVDLDRNRGLLWIAANQIDGNLTCRGNDPSPAGHLNQVSGSIRGQCRQLQTLGSDEGAPEADTTDEPEQEPGLPSANGDAVALPDGPSAPVGPNGPGGPPPQNPAGSPPASSGGNGSSTGLTLDPQPSGGGGAAGLVDIALLMALLSCGLLGGRRAHAAAGKRRKPPQASRKLRARP